MTPKKKLFNRRIKITRSCLRIRKILISPIRKNVYLNTDQQALQPLIKRNRCNKQYSARLTRWLDQLAHFGITIQHIAGSNLKITDFLSSNPIQSATTENVYDEQWVINILKERAELKNGSIITSESQNKVKTHEKQLLNQSENDRATEKNRSVIKLKQQIETSPFNNLQNYKREQYQASELPLPHHQNKMERNYSNWGASAEIMEIIRNRRKGPEKTIGGKKVRTCANNHVCPV